MLLPASEMRAASGIVNVTETVVVFQLLTAESLVIVTLIASSAAKQAIVGPFRGCS
jgi:hypothetical protein